MFGVVSVNGLARPGRLEDLHGIVAIGAGAAIEGFGNVRVRFERILFDKPSRARGLVVVEFRGFSVRSEASGMSTECQHAAYRLRTTEPLQWRVAGTRVARHRN